MADRALHDVKIHVRFKLAALWSALMFCYVYGDYFGLYVPGKLKGMLEGRGPFGPVDQSSLVIASLMLALPGLMVAASLLVPARVIRVLSIVLGVFYAVIVALTMPGAWWFYLTLSAIEILLSLAIAAVAWRWPREQ